MALSKHFGKISNRSHSAVTNTLSLKVIVTLCSHKYTYDTSFSPVCCYTQAKVQPKYHELPW